MGIPYGLILVGAAGVLAVRHATTDHASYRSKWAVGGVALASVLTPASWSVVNALAQLSVCVYVILHRIVTDALAAGAEWWWPGRNGPSDWGEEE